MKTSLKTILSMGALALIGNLSVAQTTPPATVPVTPPVPQTFVNDIGDAKVLYAGQDDATGNVSMYPRVIGLQHSKEGKGILLATFEQYVRGVPSFPVFRSTDEGKTWSLYSKITDTKNNFGMRYQPVLFELPQKVGDMPAGTILCAGSSIPSDLSSTELLLYKSTDGAKTWEFVSSIVKGGRARYVANGGVDSPVWEPYLALDKKARIVCYYSDEQSKKDGYNQLLCHKISADGKTWEEPVFDVAIPDGKTRPGMVVTAKMPNGKWIMVYEVVNKPKVPVYFRYSDDGDNWGDFKDLGFPIVDESNGYFPSGTPYIVWTPEGGKNGTLIATSKSIVKSGGPNTGDGYFINKNLGQGSWTFVNSKFKYDPKPQAAGYSQALIPIAKGKKILRVVAAVAEGRKATMYYIEEDVK